MSRMLPQNTWMSASPQRNGLPGRGLGQYTGNPDDAPIGTPMFLDASGQAVVSIPCGQPYSFQVKGYASVWLSQAKDGYPQHDGPIDVPLFYTAACDTEPGLYSGAVYEVDYSSGLGPGAYLGATELTITPNGGFSLGSMSPLVIAGLVGAFLLFRKRR